MAHSKSSLTADNGRNILFPFKLHSLLEAAEQNGQNHVVSWLPDGKAFLVHDKEKFANEIMPDYFGSSKFKTFQRNLNLWGYCTITQKGPNKGAIFHPFFQRGRPNMCDAMIRTRIKGPNEKASYEKHLKNPQVGKNSNDQDQNESHGHICHQGILQGNAVARHTHSVCPNQLLHASHVLGIADLSRPQESRAIPTLVDSLRQLSATRASMIGVTGLLTGEEFGSLLPQQSSEANLFHNPNLSLISNALRVIEHTPSAPVRNQLAENISAATILREVVHEASLLLDLSRTAEQHRYF